MATGIQRVHNGQGLAFSAARGTCDHSDDESVNGVLPVLELSEAGLEIVSKRTVSTVLWEARSAQFVMCMLTRLLKQKYLDDLKKS